MRAACMDCPRAEAPYAEAEAAFAQATASLSSRDAQHMSESDLERELHRRGQELMRTLLQGHLEQRSPGEAAGPVEGADGVERAERRVHERHLETIFGTVQVERLGYARPGHDSLHPLDAALNLPPERYSLEVRRRVAQAAASRSFDDALFDLARTTGAAVPKRQAEALVVRAAQDFDAFYEARREADGPPLPEGAVAVRGDVHLVSLDPTTGSEIRKTRPCLVISLTSPAPTLISPGRLSHRLLAQGAGVTPSTQKVTWTKPLRGRR